MPRLVPTRALAARRASAALALLALAVPALPARLDGQPRPQPAAGRGNLAAAAGPAADTTRLQALEWRNVGPFRGGRVTTVAGHPAHPHTFYMGATGGGVWKTDDAGGSWRNVSDGHLAMGSVGAIAVAPSDPNVIFVGMGESPVRGVSSSYGDGVYRSTDAGRSWTHLGLEKTRTISRVLVHPRNDSIVYVAAQGTRWGPSDDRGIYRSFDAGRTWKRVHFVDRTSGPAELSMDATNPRILYAAYWDQQRTPWFVRSGGPGSGIWKSGDGGDTWQKLAGGLPAVMGKTSVAVSPANADRVWALVEADSGGLYRSDDAGKTFRRVNDERVLRARAWYYMHLVADPQSADVVYVLNAPFLKSIDGGRTARVRQGHALLGARPGGGARVAADGRARDDWAHAAPTGREVGRGTSEATAARTLDRDDQRCGEGGWCAQAGGCQRADGPPRGERTPPRGARCAQRAQAGGMKTRGGSPVRSDMTGGPPEVCPHRRAHDRSIVRPATVLRADWRDADA